MPNHVTHRVVIVGSKERIAAFKAAFVTSEKSKDGGTVECFDFNTVIPMPEAIRNSESSSAVSDGLAILKRTDIPSGFGSITTLEQMLAWPWVIHAEIKDVETLKAKLLERSPDCVEKAKAAIACYEQHGHTSWYDWSIAKWGTKWNAYSFGWSDVSETEAVMTFDTAWSSPEQVFEAMASMDGCRDLEIEIVGFDEGWNFAFVGRIADGEYSGAEVQATAQLYEHVYGEAPDVDENEEEDTSPALITAAASEDQVSA